MIIETIVFITTSTIISLISFISSGYLLYKDHKDHKETNKKLYIDDIDIKIKKLYGEPY
jgi:hypothetical protein